MTRRACAAEPPCDQRIGTMISEELILEDGEVAVGADGLSATVECPDECCGGTPDACCFQRTTWQHVHPLAACVPYPQLGSCGGTWQPPFYDCRDSCVPPGQLVRAGRRLEVTITASGQSVFSHRLGDKIVIDEAGSFVWQLAVSYTLRIFFVPGFNECFIEYASAAGWAGSMSGTFRSSKSTGGQTITLIPALHTQPIHPGWGTLRGDPYVGGQGFEFTPGLSHYHAAMPPGVLWGIVFDGPTVAPLLQPPVPYDSPWQQLLNKFDSGPNNQHGPKLFIRPDHSDVLNANYEPLWPDFSFLWCRAPCTGDIQVGPQSPTATGFNRCVWNNVHGYQNAAEIDIRRVAEFLEAGVYEMNAETVWKARCIVGVLEGCDPPPGGGPPGGLGVPGPIGPENEEAIRAYMKSRQDCGRPGGCG